jgi:hypothetical protein
MASRGALSEGQGGEPVDDGARAGSAVLVGGAATGDAAPVVGGAAPSQGTPALAASPGGPTPSARVGFDLAPRVRERQLVSWVPSSRSFAATSMAPGTRRRRSSVDVSRARARTLSMRTGSLVTPPRSYPLWPPLLAVALTLVCDALTRIYMGTVARFSQQSSSAPATGLVFYEEIQAVVSCALVLQGFGELLTSNFFGTLSDCFGRKVVGLISAFTMTTDMLLVVWSLVNVGGKRWEKAYLFLFLGKFIDGLSCSFEVSVQAYVADISQPEQHERNLIVLQVCRMVGFVLGPAVGFVLDQATEQPALYAVSFAACVGVLLVLIVHCCWADTVQDRRVQEAEHAARTPRGARGHPAWPSEGAPSWVAQFAAACQQLGPHEAFRWLAGQTARCRSVAVLRLFNSIMQFGVLSTLVLYLRNGMRKGTDEVALVVAAFGLGSIFHLTVLFPVLNRYFPPVVPHLATYGLTGVGMYILSGLRENNSVGPAVTAVVLFSAIGTARPVQQAMAAREVDPSKQGHLAGALGTVEALGKILGSAAGWLLVAAAPKTGLQFASAALLCGPSAAVVVALSKDSVEHHPVEEGDTYAVEASGGEPLLETELALW